MNVVGYNNEEESIKIRRLKSSIDLLFDCLRLDFNLTISHFQEVFEENDNTPSKAFIKLYLYVLQIYQGQNYLFIIKKIINIFLIIKIKEKMAPYQNKDLAIKIFKQYHKSNKPSKSFQESLNMVPMDHMDLQKISKAIGGINGQMNKKFMLS